MAAFWPAAAAAAPEPTAAEARSEAELFAREVVHAAATANVWKRLDEPRQGEGSTWCSATWRPNTTAARRRHASAGWIGRGAACASERLQCCRHEGVLEEGYVLDLRPGMKIGDADGSWRRLQGYCEREWWRYVFKLAFYMTIPLTCSIDEKKLLWKPQDGSGPPKSAWGTRRWFTPASHHVQS